MKPVTLLFTLSLFVYQTACAQTPSHETAYFSDVTATHVPYDPQAHALGVALSDVDEDGDLDVILALEMDANRLYLNDGKGKLSWQKGVFEEANHDTEHVRIADFDQDGHKDIIFVAEDDQVHEYYLGNSDGSFRNVSDRLLGKSEGNGLDVGDVNGDGLPDIVVGNSGEEGQNFLWINDASRPGHFIDRTDDLLPQVNDATQSIKLADLNGDSHLDMVVSNEVPPNRLLINDGTGKFKEAANQLDLPISLHTREALVFDADGDKDQDIVFANLTSNGRERDKDPRMRLLLNNGSAQFIDVTKARMPDHKFSTYAAAPIDFDQDGDMDILLSAIAIPPFEAMQMQAFQNDGNGNFKDVSPQVIPEETTGLTWGIAIGDLNKDGIADAFIGGWGSQARLLLGKQVSSTP